MPAIIATLPLIPYKQACYRIIDFATLTKLAPMMPLYVLGPGVNGQRYTPKGGPSALYVAEDPVTVLAEYNRVERVVLVADPTQKRKKLVDPTVQLTIKVNLERVLDITDAAIQAALNTTTAELTGPWRKQMIRGLFCPTHVLANAVYATGTIQAMRYPSAQSWDHANLIIWDERVQLPSTVTVNDSSGTLLQEYRPSDSMARVIHSSVSMKTIGFLERVPTRSSLMIYEHSYKMVIFAQTRKKYNRATKCLNSDDLTSPSA